MDQILAVVVGIILLICLISCVVGIADYVMSSLGLHKIASGREISNPWMAWIPIASDWIVGKIAEDYDERNGISRRWSTVLLTLSVIYVIGIIVMCTILFLILSVMGMKYGDTEPSVSAVFGALMGIYVPVLIWAVVAMAYSICLAICVYKIFESTVPEKSLKYWLLYLIVPLAGGICLLKCRDKGYPEPQEVQ